MNVDDIQRVCALGSGTMGLGSAFYFANAGRKVDLYIQEDAPDKLDRMPIDRKIEKRMRDISSIADSFVREGIISSVEADHIMGRISPTSSLQDAGRRADFVIEHISEEEKDKKDIFGKLDIICPRHAIFASGTSAISPTKIAHDLSPSRRSQFVIAHGFVPAQLMLLVEVVPGLHTSPHIVRIANDFLETIGKEPIVLEREGDGFVVNEVQCSILAASCKLVEAGVASADEVDSAVRSGLGLSSMDIASEIKQYMKTGPVPLDQHSSTYIVDVIKDAMLESARRLVRNGIATPEVISKALKSSLALRLPETGPLESADLGGLDIFDSIFKTLKVPTPNLMRAAIAAGNKGTKSESKRGIHIWTPEREAETRGRREAALFAYVKEKHIAFRRPPASHETVAGHLGGAVRDALKHRAEQLEHGIEHLVDALPRPGVSGPVLAASGPSGTGSG